jgi:ubiquinone/menaquinone biosynthesis C-methylase UbiE
LTDWLIGTTTTLDRMRLRPGQRVLEMGPGPGRLLIPAARRILPGGQAVGLDIQPEMVARLQRRAELERVENVSAEVGDAQNCGLKSESFDLVFLCAALGEMTDRGAVLRECFRVLRPGGQLSITEIFPDPHFQSRSTVVRLATENGFVPHEVLGTWYYFTANFVKGDARQVSEAELASLAETGLVVEPSS